MYWTLMTSTAPAVHRNQVVHTSIVQCCRQSCNGCMQKKSQQIRVKISINCSPLNHCWHFADSLRRSSMRGNLQWGPETTGSDWTPVCSIIHKQMLHTFYTREAMLARVLAMALCLPVCLRLSQVGVLSNWTDRLIWILACRLLSTSPMLCYKEIQLSTKISVLPSGTLS